MLREAWASAPSFGADLTDAGFEAGDGRAELGGAGLEGVQLSIGLALVGLGDAVADPALLFGLLVDLGLAIGLLLLLGIAVRCRGWPGPS